MMIEISYVRFWASVFCAVAVGAIMTRISIAIREALSGNPPKMINLHCFIKGHEIRSGERLGFGYGGLVEWPDYCEHCRKTEHTTDIHDGWNLRSWWEKAWGNIRLAVTRGGRGE